MLIGYDDYYSGDSSDTVANDTGLSVVAGNLLVVVVGVYNMTGKPTVSSIADTAGNTYALAIRNDGLFSNIGLEMWYAENAIANANNVVTATLSKAGTNRYISTSQFDSTLRNNSLKDTSSQSNASVTSHGSGTVTTNNVNDLIIGTCVVSGSATDFTVGSGFYTLSSDLSNVLHAAEYKTASSAGDTSATFTTSGGANSNVLAAVFGSIVGPFPTSIR